MSNYLPAVISLLSMVFAGIVLFAMAGWGVLAIFYSSIESSVLRLTLAVIFGLLGLIALAGLVTRRWSWWPIAVAGFLVAFAITVAWWSTIKPSNSRDWQPEVARLATATLNGDFVAIHNIRNLDYRTETDFTARYYDKTFDLGQLSSVDLVSVYWMGSAIAHLFLSFGFADQDYLAISIEMRKEKGETYSAIKGLFKQYELYYAVANERDVIRVRTNFRNPEEQVYLYRTRITISDARLMFLDYIDSINRLAGEPEFFNTLTSNCTTNILLHTHVFPSKLRYNWKILLSGFAAEYLYELGGLDTSLPFDELKRRSLINGRAHDADGSDDFSQRIRYGLPMPAPSIEP